ncbi:flagellar basal-body MS-ring/collar protein FliF [Belnapia moabensis]|uniref:flagellar basal-body MS-ring/collar protein FliF n=1 Tax=Belnapia moabensis TaxID=365533 RepID=UPI000693FFE7|nr:flagellar basal-body MS-ring/collar protein FliF [Belnapia moabensis]
METKTLEPAFQLRSLGASLAGLGSAKLAALSGVALAALVGVVLVARAPQSPNGLLYSGLEPADAGRIVARLEELKIPLDARGDGTILVPLDQVPRLRMQLASEGLPRQTGAGYELLDQASPMQMTSFMQRVQRLRALEGELARTIITMHGVRTARVHIVLPERESFSRDAPPPTASVTVTTQAGQRLGSAQAAAIRLLVAGAVPRLRQEGVSVVDPTGIVLAADGGTGAIAGRVGELRAAQEAVYQKAVLDLLEPIVGHGKVRAIAAVEIDAARVVAREEKYDPLGQVERSRQTSTEQETNEDSRGQQPVTVGQNLPNQQVAPNNQRTNATAQRNNETINYEISSRTEETTREPGAVRRLSVAVVVDGAPDANGVIQPRSAAELERFTALVRSAVGFNEQRGDRVTVDGMRFLSEDPLGTLAGGEVAATGIAWWQLGLGLVVVLTAGGGVLLHRRRVAAAARAAAATSAQSEALQEAIANIGPDLQIRLSSLNALNELIDERPDEALSVVRAWIQEGTPG